MSITPVEPGVLNVHGKKHKGRIFQVQGTVIECFYIRTLASALHKTVDTILRWEREGVLPKPVYKLSGKQDRFYSKEQIINIYNVWMLYPYGIGAGRAEYKQRFFEAVKAVFYKKEILNANRTHRPDSPQKL